MQRVIHPPLSELSFLRVPLTAGERRVIDFFHERLSPEWELYIQPHLNGLRPDLVLLNPKVGIAVFEIKDWDLDAMRYHIDNSTGNLVLKATDGRGKVFAVPDPVSKVLLYQKEISELYCPRLDAKSGIAVISAGLIFTRASSERVETLLRPLRQREQAIEKYPQYFPLAGMDALDDENLSTLFPEHGRKRSKHMTHDTAEDLRGWLREPDFSSQQRRHLELDARQLELVNTRTASGYRRIKGPAGAGKSLVLAARASKLASEGKRVLVVTYNITLKNYLRDLAARHGPGGSRSLREIDFLSFHYWCKRTCTQAGMEAEYAALWRNMPSFADAGESDMSDVLNDKLADLTRRISASAPSAGIAKYDAIIVDEGQDFRLSWWNALRAMLKEGGEMLLAADKSQDIYGQSSAWTEEAMVGAGFAGGRWAELKVSYRLPPSVAALVSQFARAYMTSLDLDLPESVRTIDQGELADLSTRLRWVQVRDPNLLSGRVADEVQEMLKRLTETTAVADLVLLLPTHRLGQLIVDEIHDRFGIRVHHTFDEDKQVARKKKLAFFKGDARVKATTLYSFKGWESRHLIVLVESMDRRDDAALLYTAMTRLRRDPAGSCLTVVSTCPKLHVFGSMWPEFVEN